MQSPASSPRTILVILVAVLGVLVWAGPTASLSTASTPKVVQVIEESAPTPEPPVAVKTTVTNEGDIVPPAIAKRARSIGAALIEGAAPSPGSFIRMTHDEEGQPLALETAVARYVPAIGGGDLVVDLIGVVHFGDRTYYQRMNTRFMQYDALLYELVAAREHAVPDPNQRDNKLNMIIRKLAVLLLDLDSQLKLIDYTKPNFVHADLSPQGIAMAMAERGENKITLALGVVTDLIRQYNMKKYQAMQGEHDPMAQQMASINWKNDWKLYFLDPAGASRLRGLAAASFASMTSSSVGGFGETIERILIDDRNKEAIRIFEEQIIDGKRHIGIFYGAAHMPDFEKRLMSRFGLKRESVEWVPAWDLRLRQRSPMEVIFKMMRP